jgi:5-formyltetrahydrofolate cyclo-ligase
MNKAALRKIYTAKRQNLTLSQTEEGSRLIAQHFIESDIWKGCSTIHVFSSIPNKKEVDTAFIVNYFQTNHPEIKLCTSIVADNGIDLTHSYIYPETNYQANKWGIPEPLERVELIETEIDLVLLPLLAFDVKGNRVGYGKGFYDRFLKKSKHDVIKVGLSLFDPIEELIEVDAWDVPMDVAIVPNTIIRFNS